MEINTYRNASVSTWELTKLLGHEGRKLLERALIHRGLLIQGGCLFIQMDLRAI